MSIKNFFISFSCACVALFSLSHTMAQSPDELLKRQCRSVHSHFLQLPKPASALYNVVIPLKSAPGTYFCAMNFDDGYIGFQELANGKKVIIFSIWDPIPHGDNPHDVPENERTQLVELGKNTRVGRFGGEGTGGQSFIDYDWKLGEKMQFFVCLKKKGNFKTIAGYFYNNHTKSFELISKWRTHSSQKELSFAVGFIEDFLRNYKSTQFERTALFGPCFAFKDGKWSYNTEVGFTGDSTPSPHVKAEIQPNGSLLMQTGGKTEISDFKLFSSSRLPMNISPVVPSNELNNLIKKL